MESNLPNDPYVLKQRVKEVWEQNADYWDRGMGEGNKFHKLLIEPAQLRLLNIRPGERILDIACGNGQFARKMADLGASLIAVDASARMIENARRRSSGYEGRIEYRVIDCSETQALLALGERQFDGVVCTMALMDICEVRPIVSASAKLLKNNGYFVFSVLHPCFNSGLAKQGMERHDIGGELVEEYFVRVFGYSRPMTTKGLALQGQPVPQYYFHRSLAVLFNEFFTEGFVLDGLEEPTFGSNAANTFETVYKEIPPALVARFRLMQQPVA